MPGIHAHGRPTFALGDWSSLTAPCVLNAAWMSNSSVSLISPECQDAGWEVHVVVGFKLQVILTV